MIDLAEGSSSCSDLGSDDHSIPVSYAHLSSEVIVLASFEFTTLPVIGTISHGQGIDATLTQVRQWREQM